MILHDWYKKLVVGVKLSFAGWFHLRPHFIVADWMTAFLLVPSFLFQNDINHRSYWSIIEADRQWRADLRPWFGLQKFPGRVSYLHVLRRYLFLL